MGNKQGKLYPVTTWRKILGCAQGTVLGKKNYTESTLKISSTQQSTDYHIQVRKLTEAGEKTSQKN